MTTTIIDRDDLRAELGDDVANTDHNAQLDLIFLFVNKWMGDELDRELDKETYTHDLSGNGQRILKGREWPITDITSITISSDWEFAAATAEDTTDYKVSDINTRDILRKGSMWPLGCANIRVVYTAGYTSVTMPQSLVAVARWIGAWIFRNIDRSGHGIQSQADDNQSFSFNAGDLPANHAKTMDHYGRRGVSGG